MLAVGALGVLVGREGLRRAGFELRSRGGEAAPPPGAVSRTSDGGRPATGPAPPPPSAGTGDATDGGDTAAEAGAVRTGAAGPTPVRPGPGAVVEVDFEPGAGGACAPCAVSDEWSGEGLILSFRSWTASSERPWLVDVRNYAPPGASPHAVGPALTGEQGLEVGVLRLDFPSRPRRVSFTVYGPDLIGRFDIGAWSDEGALDPAAFVRATRARYRPADRAVFRAERITIASGRGVARVALDGWGPPGHLLFVDDVRIEP